MAKRNRKIKKSFVQRTAARLAAWIVEREARLEEIKLNRAAVRMNRKIDWLERTMDRAEQLRHAPKVRM